jgi:hypothetical protein
MDKKKIVEQTVLAFDLIQKLYHEVAFLIKEIEGQLAEADERFVIGKPGGYQATYISSTGLEQVYVKKWIPRKMSVFFVPEEMTEKGGTTTTRFSDETKVIYVRIILNDDDINEPVIYYGVLYGFGENKILNKRFTKVEQIPTAMEYRENIVFKNPKQIAWNDVYVKFEGKLKRENLFDLNNSEDVNNLIVEPALKIFREV